MLRQGLPLEAALARATADLPLAEDRGLARALASTVLRHLTDLDALIDKATQKRLAEDAKARAVLRIALAQALAMGTPGHAAISTVLPLVDGGPRRLVHGVFSAVMRETTKLPDPPTLPKPVAVRWRKTWGQPAVNAARAMLGAPPPLDLSLKDESDAMDGIALAPRHRRLPAGTAVTELPGFADGAWWVQDLAASIPARLLGMGEGRTALDLCAAPGGKTMQLAAAGWTVTALDLSESRLERLSENLARTGLAATLVPGDATVWTPEAPVDAVLIDAPCSATGIFRRHPEVLHRATPRRIAESAVLQAKLLARAADWVKPGGRLVYAVCSLEPEEGESVAGAFLSAHADYAVATPAAGILPDGIRPDPNGFIRVAPGTLAQHGGADGFFVACFDRRR